MKFSKPTKTEVAIIKSTVKPFGLTVKTGRNKFSPVTVGKQCERLSKEKANEIVLALESKGFILDPMSCIQELIDKGLADTLSFYKLA